MNPENLFDEYDLFGDIGQPKAGPMPESTAKKPRKTAKKSAGDAHKETPDNEPKAESVTAETPENNVRAEVNIESLTNAIRKNGKASLSDHTEKPKKKNDGKSNAKEEPGKKNPDKASKAKQLENEKVAADGLGAYINEFIERTRKENADFAKLTENPEKNPSDCFSFVMSEALKRRFKDSCAIDNKEIDGMILHYYQEKNIQINLPSKLMAMVFSQIAPPSEDDIRKVHTMAFEQVTREKLDKEKQEIRDKILKGEEKIEYNEEQKAELTRAAQEAMLQKEIERQKKNSVRRSSARKENPSKKETPEQEFSLF